MRCKTRAPAALGLDVEVDEKRPRSHQVPCPAWGTAAGVQKVLTPAPPQDTQVSAHTKSILAKVKQLIAKAHPRICRPRTPPDAAPPRLPGPAGAAGRESFWAAPSLAPPPGSRGAAPPVQPGAAAGLVPCVGLSPCSNPWLAVPALAAALAVAVPTPPHGPSPTAPQCPTRATSAAAAGHGDGPSVAHTSCRGECWFRVNGNY